MSSFSLNRRHFIHSLLAGGSLAAAPSSLLRMFSKEKKFSALVLERSEIKGLWGALSGDLVSPVGNQLGAYAMLEQAGFETSWLNLDIPFGEQQTDLLLLGSYISTHEDIVRYLEENRQSIHEFVENGGVVVQFVESPTFDQFYNSSLPEKETSGILLPSHLRAKRTRETFWGLHVRTPEHTLLKGMQIDGSTPDTPGLSEQFGHNATWMAIGEREGFNVLVSNTEDDSRTALIEGVHGKGRYILCSIFFDKLFDEDGKTTRSSGFMETAKTFYHNLLDYTHSLQEPDGLPAVIGGAYRDPVPAVFPQGAFTLVLIPDTQYYCQTPEHNHHFHNIVDWITDNRETFDIRYALHLGDVVNRGGIEMHQWDMATEAMYKLGEAVPYSIALGNHDYTDDTSRNRDTPLNDFFHPSRFENWPTFGGCMEEGHLENTFHTFEAHDTKYLILALEFGPRNHVLEWANDVVSDHSDHRAILTTHAYMYTDDHRYNITHRQGMQAWNPHNYGSEGGNNDGYDMWGKLVSRHPNFFLVAGGHVINDGLGRKSLATSHGNTVHQMLFNYQGYYQGGMGTIRLLHFHPGGKMIQVRTYSTSLDRFDTGVQQQFQLNMDLSI